MLIEDADKAVTILNAIRSTGVRLALDDFGHRVFVSILPGAVPVPNTENRSILPYPNY